MTGIVLAAITAIALTACGSALDSQECTLATCSDAVTYLISDSVTAEWPRPLTVETCIDEHCSTQQVEEGQKVHRSLTRITLPPGTLDREAQHTASIRVVDAGGRVLLDRSDTVTLHTNAPNGFDCGPVCGQAGIEVTDE